MATNHHDPTFRDHHRREAALPVAHAWHGQPAARGPVGDPAAGAAVKRRHPLGVWLGLPLITLGIYTFVWYYKIHREMADVTRRPDAPVAGPMLVLLLLGWTGIAALVSFFRTGKRIARAQRAAGQADTCNPWIGLLLCFVFGLVTLYYQTELNKIPPGAPRQFA